MKGCFACCCLNYGKTNTVSPEKKRKKLEKIKKKLAAKKVKKEQEAVAEAAELGAICVAAAHPRGAELWPAALALGDLGRLVPAHSKKPSDRRGCNFSGRAYSFVVQTQNTFKIITG